MISTLSPVRDSCFHRARGRQSGGECTCHNGMFDQSRNLDSAGLVHLVAGHHALDHTSSASLLVSHATPSPSLSTDLGQFVLALDRENACDLASAFLDFTRGFQPVRRGLEAQMKEVLDLVLERQAQLLFAHASKFGCFHVRALESRS